MTKRFVFTAIAIAGFFILQTLSSLALDEVTFRSFIEKEKIKFSEQVQFLVVVNYGTQTMRPALTPPSFAQFNVLNENEKNQEVGEGKERYRVLKRVWLLEPTETGRLSIASAIITYQDPTSNLLKNGKTEIVFVEVMPETGPDGQARKPAAKDNTVTAQSQGVPWTLLVFATVGLLVALAVLLAFKQPSAPKVLPETLAMRSLDQAIEHVEQENLEQYYAALSRALLDYLQNKFNLDAHVMDTQTLLEKIAGFGIQPDMMDAVRDFFQVADKAKFAGYVPDEDKMIELHNTVKKFIETGREIKVKAPKAKKKKSEEAED